MAPCLKITSVKDCFSKICSSDYSNDLLCSKRTFLIPFSVSLPVNVSWYAVLSGFPSYITITKVTFFIRVYFLVINNKLAHTLFELLPVRETRQSLRYNNWRSSCHRMSTDVEQSIAVYHSPQWKLKLVIGLLSAVALFLLFIYFSGYRIHIWRYRIHIKIFSQYINQTSL